MKKIYAIVSLVILTALLSASTALVAQTYNVGQVITFDDGSKGVVCYVNPQNEKQGWAIALMDLDQQYALCTDNNYSMWQEFKSSGTTPDLSWSWADIPTPAGKNNTKVLRKHGVSPAAEAVDFYNGWYIPDIYQLIYLFGLAPVLKEAIEAAGGNVTHLVSTSDSYWSSTSYSQWNNSFYRYSNNFQENHQYHYSNNYIDGVTDYPKDYNGTQLAYVRPVRDFGDEVEAYWMDPYLADGRKISSMEVSPQVTTTYDAIVVFGKDTFPITGTALVHEIYKSDTLREVVCQSDEPLVSSKSALFNGRNISQVTNGYDTISVNPHTIYGCDSIVTLLLKVVGDCQYIYHDSICPIHEGESFTSRYGFGPFGPGTSSQVREYPGVRQTLDGPIDTIAYYELTVMPEYHLNDALYLCLDQEDTIISYENNEHVTITITGGHIALISDTSGVIIDSTDQANGNFVLVMTTDFGCDSLVALHIDTSVVKHDTITRTDVIHLNAVECIDGIVGTQSGGGYDVPLSSSYNYSCSQQIYTPSEVGEARTIYTISFNYSSTTAMTAKNNVKIYLAHTDKQSFTNTSNWVSTNNMTLVYEGDLNCTGPGWNEFVLNHPFEYDGVHNLLVMVNDMSYAKGSGYFYSSYAPNNSNMCLSYYSDQQYSSWNEWRTGYLRTYRSDIRFYGCTTDTRYYTTVLDGKTFSVETTGTYTISDTVPASNGCDSIITRILVVNPPYEDVICDSTFTEDQVWVDNVGPYCWHFNDKDNCIAGLTENSWGYYEFHGTKTVENIEIDTVTYLKLTINPTHRDTTDMVFCIYGNDTTITDSERDISIFIKGDGTGITVTSTNGEKVKVERMKEGNGYNDSGFILKRKTEKGCDSIEVLYIETSVVQRDTFYTDILYNAEIITCYDPTISKQQSTYNYVPVGNNHYYSCSQQIFTSEEVGAAGVITSLSFYYSYYSTMTYKNNVKIYMAHTNKASFTNSNEWISPSQMTLVYSGNLNCSQGWNEFVLNKEFLYNGTDNLIVMVNDESNAKYYSYNSNNYQFFYSTATPNNSNMCHLYLDNYNKWDSTSYGSLYSYRSDIRFHTCTYPTVELANKTIVVKEPGIHTIMDTLPDSKGCDSITKRVIIAEVPHYDEICEEFLPTYTWHGLALPADTDAMGFYEFPGKKVIDNVEIDTVSYLKLFVIPCRDTVEICLYEEPAPLDYNVKGETLTFSVADAEVTVANAPSVVQVTAVDAAKGDFALAMKDNLDRDSVVYLHVGRYVVQRDTLVQNIVYDTATMHYFTKCNYRTIGDEYWESTSLPIDVYENYSCSQQIFTPGEIGKGGPIDTISIDVSWVPSNTTSNKNNVNIYLAHTDKQSFTDANDWVPIEGMTLVYSGSLNCASYGWNKFALDQPFEYDGTRNLLMMVNDLSNGSGNMWFFSTGTTDRMSICYYSEDEPWSPTSSGYRYTSYSRCDIGFHICSLCPPEVDFADKTFSVDQAGVYKIIDTLPGSNGCDSITIRYLIVNEPNYDTICEDKLSTYKWHGTALPAAPNAAGFYELAGQKEIDGRMMDTITYLKLALIPSPEISLTHVADLCPGIPSVELTATVTSPTKANYTYAWSGDLTLSSTSTAANQLSDTATFTIPNMPGQSYGVYVTVTDANGCEAGDETTITVKDTVEKHLYDEVCRNTAYSGNGFSVPNTETGTPGAVIVKTNLSTGANGCDSTTILHLTVNPTWEVPDELGLCLYGNDTTFTYEGNENVTISINGTGTVTTVTSANTEQVTVTPVKVGGVDSDTDFILHMKTVEGCDSVVVLHIEKNYVKRDTVYKDTVYLGTDFTTTFANHTFSVTGPGVMTFIDTTHNIGASGCDSITLITLIVEPPHEDVICDSTFTEGQIWVDNVKPYCWIENTNTCIDGLTPNSHGYYEFHGEKTINGIKVDTATYLKLTILPTYRGNDELGLCLYGNDTTITYERNENVTISINGTGTVTTVTSANTEQVTVTPVKVGGVDSDTDFILHMKTVNGCDSVVVLHIEKNYVKRDTLRDSAYLAQVVANGNQWTVGTRTIKNITEPGTYYLNDTLTASNGCDSIVVVEVVVNPCIITLNVTAHADELCGDDGTVTVEATDGIAPITYSIDGENYQAIPEFKNLPDGNYTLYAKDHYGCEATTTVTIAPARIPEMFLSCPPEIRDTLAYGDCVMDIYPERIGTPTTIIEPANWPFKISNEIPEDLLFSESDSIFTWTMEDTICGTTVTCEQKIVVVFPQCPDAIDCEGNVYHGVRIGCDCWTQTNLVSNCYGNPYECVESGTCDDTIPCVYEYESVLHPDVDENVDIFGKLYCAEAGVGDSTINEHGHIRGICPEGWYLPSPEKYAELYEYGAHALKSPLYWIDGGGDNSTDFSWLPAGWYNGAEQRFEGMLSEGYFLSTEVIHGEVKTYAYEVRYDCNQILKKETHTGIGYSVRCVKEKDIDY